MQAASFPPAWCVVAQQYTSLEPHRTQVTPSDCLFSIIRFAISIEVA
jgi:hypothetical protein